MTQDITATDMFCGLGGSTTGAVQAGVTVKLAINHWKRAIETHNTNYPKTEHILTDLHLANPRKYKKTTGLIASPECTNHSLAKGKRKREQGQSISGLEYEMTSEDEAAERSRCTMWTPLDWAECHRYQFVILENVVDIGRWEPFEAWLQAWQSLGYDFELVPFNSMHAHPTPQSRDRLYFVAWKKGNPKPDLKITPRAYCLWCGKDVDSLRAWKKPDAWTNYRLQCGKYRQQYVYACPFCNKEVTPYYYAAMNAIDWSIAAPRIGDRVKPLADKTMERIAYGLQKFGEQTLLLQTSHSACGHASYIVSDRESPFPTQTTRQDVALAIPPFILDHLAEYRPRPILGPLSTVCASGNHHSVIVPPNSWVMSYYGSGGQMVPVEGAIPTVTTHDRHAFVTSPVQSGEIAVEDCGFRMLTPDEIRAAMAFPSDYILTGTRKEQVEMLGNAVTPPVIRLLMERVVSSLEGVAA
jgi:DNA (cytosine-5)-methyltransferase 1